jgi:hypothetical protein
VRKSRLLQYSSLPTHDEAPLGQHINPGLKDLIPPESFLRPSRARTGALLLRLPRVLEARSGRF